MDDKKHPHDESKAADHLATTTTTSSSSDAFESEHSPSSVLTNQASDSPTESNIPPNKSVSSNKSIKKGEENCGITNDDGNDIEKQCVELKYLTTKQDTREGKKLKNDMEKPRVEMMDRATEPGAIPSLSTAVRSPGRQGAFRVSGTQAESRESNRLKTGIEKPCVALMDHATEPGTVPSLSAMVRNSVKGAFGISGTKRESRGSNRLKSDIEKPCVALMDQATEPGTIPSLSRSVQSLGKQGDSESNRSKNDTNTNNCDNANTIDCVNECQMSQKRRREREEHNTDASFVVRASIVKSDDSLENQVTEELRKEFKQELKQKQKQQQQQQQQLRQSLPDLTTEPTSSLVVGELVEDHEELTKLRYNQLASKKKKHSICIIFSCAAGLFLVVMMITIPMALVFGRQDSNSPPIPSMTATTNRYWDCNGGACGCGYQPNHTRPEDPELFDPAHCYSNGMFKAPENNPYGASFYGTAGISEVLGGDWWLGPGCNQCWKLTGESDINGSRSTIVVRGANFCSSLFPLCADGNAHFVIAAPGFDAARAACEHLEPELAEGLRSCVNWPNEPCDCSVIQHPTLRAGCENFLSLQWVDPIVEYENVTCPEELLITHCETDGSWPLEPIPDNCAYFPDTE